MYFWGRGPLEIEHYQNQYYYQNFYLVQDKPHLFVSPPFFFKRQQKKELTSPSLWKPVGKKSDGGYLLNPSHALCSCSGSAVDKTRGSGSGQGGLPYGDAKLSILYLGSGGGSGGNDNYLGDNPRGGYGGRGGGAIRLNARENLLVDGQVNAQGQPGQGDTQSRSVTVSDVLFLFLRLFFDLRWIWWL